MPTRIQEMGAIVSILCAVVFLCVPAGLSALPPGLAAMNDDFQALRYNPAALSQKAAAGLGFAVNYSRQADTRYIVDSLDLFLNSDVYAHSFHYDAVNDILRQRLGIGVPIGDIFALGVALELPGLKVQEMDIAASFLFRPLPYISLAAQGGLRAFKDPYIDFSLALRPFTEHVTIGIGSRFDGEIYLPRLLAVVEPVNGLRIDGGFNFADNSWHVGLSLSFSHVRLGSDIQLQETVNNGSAYVHVSPRQFQSIFTEPPDRVVEYSVGTVVEQNLASANTFSGPGGGANKELLETVEEIRGICADPWVRAVVFKENAIRTNPAGYEELRQAFSQCKEEEKPIIFYASSYGNLGYAFAASVADEIYMHQGGQIALVGYAIIFPYIKNFLDELGVNVHIYQSHPDKSAGETLGAQRMGEAAREQYELILDDYYQLLLEMLSERELRVSAGEALNGGPYLNSEYALEIGLVDGLMYEDEFDSYLAEKGWHALPHRGGEKVARSWPDATEKRVALIHAVGRISDGQSVRGILVGDESIIPAINRAATDSSIGAILLRIDSPGGSAIAADNIARAVAQAAERKPVLAWMGGVAASGGYYIASPGNLIIASPATATGSIGVLAQIPSLEGFFDKLGVNWDGVKTAPSADFSSVEGLFREPTEEEQRRIQERIEHFYGIFIDRVAAYRGARPEDIDAVAQGKVWTGRAAVENGLVDKLGDYALVMDELEKVLGGGNIRLVPFEHARSNYFSDFALFLAQTILPGLDIPELAVLGTVLENELNMLYLMPWTFNSHN